MTLQAQSIYDDTVDLLKTLDESQLKAIHSVIVQLTAAREKWHSPLGIKTEEELWNHIDHSLSQAKAGQGRDADDVIEDLMKEYGQ